METVSAQRVSVRTCVRPIRRKERKGLPPAWERLESRRLLTTAVWTGNAGDGLFSTPGNWSGNAAPTTGQSVDFPNLGQVVSITIDNTPEVGAVSVEGDYAFTYATDAQTNEISVDGDITVAASHTASFAGNVNFNSSTTQTLDIGSGATAEFAGVDSAMTLSSLMQTGAGTALMDGGNGQFTASWQVEQGTFDTEGQVEVAPEIDGSTAVLTGSGTVMGLVSSGIVNLSNGSAPTQMVSQYNTYFYGGEVDMTINATRSDPNDPSAVQSSLLTNNLNGFDIRGATALNLTLGSNYVHHPGDVITLFQANAGFGGTFSNLADGATVVLGGYSFVINYNAGNTNHNVTLTALAVTPTIALQTDSDTLNPGDTAHLTATVSDPNGTPTGTVTFYDNAVQVGSPVALANDGTATIDAQYDSPGSHDWTASYSGDSNYASVTSTATNITVNSPDTPTVDLAPWSSTTDHKHFDISILGADAGGESSLTYTWSVVKKPTGAAAPTFLSNGTNDAQDSTVTFAHAGSYTLRCTITNGGGKSVTSDLSISVPAVATKLQLTSTKTTLKTNQSTTITAAVLDQFKKPITQKKAPKFSVVQGSGKVSTAGVLKAGNRKGKLTVRVNLGGLTGNIYFTVAKG